jgi:CHAT domain-containing protein/lipopolysaccharide biosynthesis regulator YciM
MFKPLPLFVFLFSISLNIFSQTISFKEYRYKNIDTNKVKKYKRSITPDSLLAIKYSSLYAKKQKVEYLYLLNNLAQSYLDKNNLQKAQNLLTSNISISNKVGLISYEQGYSNLLLTTTYRKQRNYKQMVNSSTRFVEILEQISADSTILSKAYSDAAKYNFMSKNLREGFNYFDKSNEIAEKLNLIPIIQDNYTNAGNILSFYEPQQATKFMEYAIYLSKSNKYSSPNDIVYLNLITGATFMARNIFDKAIYYFENALTVLQKNKLNNKRFEDVLNYYIASSYKWLKEYDKAVKQLEYFKDKNGKYSKMAISSLGEIYLDQENYDSALYYLEQMYETYPKQSANSFNIKALNTLSNISKCNIELNNFSIAKSQIRKCLFYMANDSIITSNKLLPNSTPNNNYSYDYWHSFMKLYIQILEHEYENNKGSFNSVYLCYIQDIDALNNKVFIKNNLSAKFVFSSKAKNTSIRFLEFLSSKNNIPDSIITKVWETVAYSKNNYLNSQFSKKATKLNLKTDDQIKYDSLQREFKILSQANKDNDNYRIKAELLNCYKESFVLSYDKKAKLLYPSIELNVNINRALRNLDSKTAVIDLYSNDSSLFYFSYVNNKTNFHKIDNAKEVFRTTNSFKRSIKTGEKISMKESSYILNGLGISNTLNKNKNYSLFFIPDNSLATFPIEVLLDNNNQFLITNHTISYLNSVSQLSSINNENKYNTEISCFAPSFTNTTKIAKNTSNNRTSNGMRLSPLPYSIDECKEIDSLFRLNEYSSTIMLNEKATINNFMSELNKSKIVHIATHGVASKTSFDKTGIYLYDSLSNTSFLSFSQIQNNSIKSDLIVLSACKTSEGKNIKGEGKISLPYGFIFAGAKSVIASLWNVSDKKTQEIMMDFYKNIIEKNMKYSEALQQAKLASIKRGDSPLDWSSFIYIGK